MIALGTRTQVLWPPHCVQGSANAGLLLEEALFEAVVQKGKDKNHDSYSGFRDDGGSATELNDLLQHRRLTELIVYGIATDYCVKATAEDGAKAGYRVTVVETLCRGVAPDTTAAALKARRAAGVAVVTEI